MTETHMTFNNEEVVARTIPMPKDTNASGDIFGGWLVSQMDLGGAVIAARVAKGRIATVAITDMVFKHPVKVGDLITCTGHLKKLGNTSIAIQVKVWSRAMSHEEDRLVAHGLFTYVAIDANGRPRPIKSA